MGQIKKKHLQIMTTNNVNDYVHDSLYWNDNNSYHRFVIVCLFLVLLVLQLGEYNKYSTHITPPQIIK